MITKETIESSYKSIGKDFEKGEAEFEKIINDPEFSSIESKLKILCYLCLIKFSILKEKEKNWDKIISYTSNLNDIVKSNQDCFNDTPIQNNIIHLVVAFSKLEPNPWLKDKKIFRVFNNSIHFLGSIKNSSIPSPLVSGLSRFYDNLKLLPIAIEYLREGNSDESSQYLHCHEILTEFILLLSEEQLKNPNMEIKLNKNFKKTATENLSSVYNALFFHYNLKKDLEKSKYYAQKISNIREKNTASQTSVNNSNQTNTSNEKSETISISNKSTTTTISSLNPDVNLTLNLNINKTTKKCVKKPTIFAEVANNFYLGADRFGKILDMVHSQISEEKVEAWKFKTGAALIKGRAKLSPTSDISLDELYKFVEYIFNGSIEKENDGITFTKCRTKSFRERVNDIFKSRKQSSKETPLNPESPSDKSLNKSTIPIPKTSSLPNTQPIIVETPSPVRQLLSKIESTKTTDGPAFPNLEVAANTLNQSIQREEKTFNKLVGEKDRVVKKLTSRITDLQDPQLTDFFKKQPNIDPSINTLLNTRKDQLSLDSSKNLNALYAAYQKSKLTLSEIIKPNEKSIEQLSQGTKNKHPHSDSDSADEVPLNLSKKQRPSN